MTIKTYTPDQAIQAAIENGQVQISSGVYLNSKASILADQADWDDRDASKNIDFLAAPFWITTNDGYVSPIEGSDDQELIETLADA